MDFKETLTENQKIIYEIIKNFLRKTPHFTIDELFSICKKKSELSDNVISIILDKFIRKKVFIPGSLLIKETVLKNERRAEIYQYISTNPGLNFNQIIKYFKIGTHVGYLHLAILKKFGFIREQKFKIYNLYFHKDFPKDKEMIIFFLRNPNILNMYRCLKYHPLNSNALSKILGLHYSTVQYHLKQLIQYQIIVQNSMIYEINPEHSDFLERYYNLTIPQDFKDLIEVYLLKNESKVPLGKKSKSISLIR